MTLEQAIKEGHALSLYYDSERADEKTGAFDDLWQSVYDITQVASFGIVDAEEEEIQEASAWLKATQALTENYKTLPVEF